MTDNQFAGARAGVAVFVFRDGRFLMGRRRGAHGDGTWSIPGGHPEFGETLEDAASREVVEETGLTIDRIRFGAVTNDVFHDDHKHYVTIWMLSDYVSGEATLVEPDKYDRHGWYDFSVLPKPLFLPWRQLLLSSFMDSIRNQLADTARQNNHYMPEDA